MKKWISIIIALVLLTIALGVNIWLYKDQSRTITNLVSRMQTIENEAIQQQTTIEHAQELIAGLEDHIELLQDGNSQTIQQLAQLQAQITGIGQQEHDLEVQLESILIQVSNIEQRLSGLDETRIPVTQLVESIKPVVVYVEGMFLSYKVSGSGILISNDGLVVTNYHVVEDMRNITVVVNSDITYSAQVLDYDAGRDLAVLKIDSDRNDFTYASFGDSDRVSAGESVLAMGYPSPLGDDTPGNVSVTQGIVSAIRRFDGYNYIQVDAAINPGNSGGALVNRWGDYWYQRGQVRGYRYRWCRPGDTCERSHCFFTGLSGVA
jgi:S1-C subfamily serine protease